MNTPLTAPHFARIFSLFVLALLLGFAKPAQAGEFAERRILGFSPDGRYFAFEQFGVQDGSGFPYADIFLVDTATDEWVGGSPFRVRLRDERAQLKEARKEALNRAGDLLRKLAISEPGRLLASNPPGELSADPYRVEVNVSQIAGGAPDRRTFTLEETALANARCAAFTAMPIKGFRLTTQRQDSAPQVLHSDTSIPKSRGCPLRYAISDIIVFEAGAGRRVFAILVSVYALGFEGPDRRFMAITRALN
ncbi:hypothetical protein BMS3Bbin10_00520 [bacterium BMS3Bbin10]|nr:hypothetical protein BMS3Bbin10_00520 [bacterium BMS3Bbin10]